MSDALAEQNGSNVQMFKFPADMGAHEAPQSGRLRARATSRARRLVPVASSTSLPCAHLDSCPAHFLHLRVVLVARQLLPSFWTPTAVGYGPLPPLLVPALTQRQTAYRTPLRASAPFHSWQTRLGSHLPPFMIRTCMHPATSSHSISLHLPGSGTSCTRHL